MLEPEIRGEAGGRRFATSLQALLAPQARLDRVCAATPRLARASVKPAGTVSGPLASDRFQAVGKEPSTEVEGIDSEGVERWFAENVPDASPPFGYERITGGRSNLTFRVTDEDGGTWALRRPPLSGALSSAHDMGREHRVVSALTPTEVPVPDAVALCEDESVTGVPFYVMDFVEGPVLRDEETACREFSEDERRKIGESVVDALVTLHSVEPDEVGLGELGRKWDYVERQLKRWHGQWKQSKTREIEAIDDVHRRLSQNVPEQQRATIAHGAYRLDNLILSPAGAIAAIVDWELCTLGDPLADVGLLHVYWSQPGDEVLPLGSAPTTAPGFPDRGELTERYAERSGLDLSTLDFYVALGYWKLAIILEGVYARYAQGGYGESDEEIEHFPRVVEALADSAARSSAEMG